MCSCSSKDADGPLHDDLEIDRQKLISHFRNQAQQGRGECIHGVLYFVISEADREAFPELRQSYAIALQELSTRSGDAQYWLVTSEAEYDDEILLALSSLG